MTVHKISATDDEDIENYTTKRFLKDQPINLDVVGEGYTTFTTGNERGEIGD
ncbi:MAG: hypothetical protein QM401_04815 [Bacillota bacterium]|nr:hypothetical protein [Bacillota bacterium]HHU60969.1 hypothetical protein [Natronincola sp.]